MTSIEYKTGMIQSLDDLARDIQKDFWNDLRYETDGKMLYISTIKRINKRILELQREIGDEIECINREIDELSKRA